MKNTTYFLFLAAIIWSCSSSSDSIGTSPSSSEIGQIATVQLDDEESAVFVESLLQSGPMTGYSSRREVGIWVQTTEAATVKIAYRPGVEYSWMFSESYLTERSSAYTAHVQIGGLDPGMEYEYEVYINDELESRPYPLRFQTQDLWQYRHDPPPFKFVIGSCAYINEQDYERPGRFYGGEYKIFNRIAEEDADLMVWLGDNTYLREVDWDSQSGVYHRYTHSRSLDELQPLLGAMHHQAVWDDHDFGPNDCDGSFYGKQWTLQAFKDFWMNPVYNAAGEGGISGQFSWQDCDFFMLDNRWVRTDQGEKGQILGKKQLSWLRLALKNSRAPFKFICIGGQTLSDAAVYENQAQYPTERNALLDMIEEERIHGVVFLNGDRHSSEVSRLINDENIGLYEVTSSPLTAGAHGHEDEPNTLRIPGSMIEERNYAVLEVSGPRTDRTCSVTYKNVDGKVIYKHELKVWKWSRG